MNPVEIGKGRSFKGLASYLLFEKDAAAEAAQEASERVGWAESFNLMDAPPAKAWRLMASTAISAPQLKQAAGIRPGKATEKPVYHYTLTFNPEDQPSRDVQRAAVTSSLAALGLKDYQALAVMHHDKAHLHVHVMVNLIHPENGISASSKQPDGRPAPLSMSQMKLSKWAMGFEREHGLAVTEGRIANQAARANGETVEARRLTRPEYEQAKAEGTDVRLSWLRREQDGKRAEIADRQSKLRYQQRAEWAALNESYKLTREAIRDGRRDYRAISAEVKKITKPEWAALFRKHRDELRAFERQDSSPLGKLWHIVSTAVSVGREKGALTGLAAALSKEERRSRVVREQERQSAELGRIVRARIAHEITLQKKEDDRRYTAARDDYLQQCAALKKAHAQQWNGVRANWREYNAERRKAAERARSPIRGRSQAQGRNQDQGIGRSRGREPSGPGG
jgi:hypothetical protein